MKSRLSIAFALTALAAAACGAPSAAPPSTGTPTAAPVGEPSTAASPSSTPQPSAEGLLTYVILPEESEVRFLIGEVLAGSHTIVVGRTRDIRGELAVDLSDPSTARLDIIQVDLSTLATDNSFRNRSIHSVILETGRDEYRFASFVTTAIEGLPDKVVIGEEYTLRLTGDLSIHGVTRPFTFEVHATADPDGRLVGHASLSFLYPEFGIRIPYLPPQVASVEEQVTLEVDLVFARR